MTFKQIIKAISEGTPVDEICGMIDNSFGLGKISWSDHEMLYNLIARLAD
jgi:hypothetical protein